MAKLDEKGLDELIKEVINIKVTSPSQAHTDLGDPAKTVRNKKFYTGVASAVAPNNTIEDNDFEQIFKKYKEIDKIKTKDSRDRAKKYYDYAVGLMKNSTNDQVKKDIAAAFTKVFPPDTPSGQDAIAGADGTPDDIESNIEDLESGLISDPRTYNIGAAQAANDDGSYPKAQFPSSVHHTLDAVLAGESSLRGRITLLNKFSEAMVVGDMDALKTLIGMQQGATPTAEDKRKLLNACLAVDYMAAISKNMDNQAAAYIFESFLALICGGVQKGGDNKAGDFLMSDNSEGSAKYYGDKKGSAQAVSGFIKNKKVTYVHAVKQTTAGGTATNPKELTSIDIYLYDITFSDLGQIRFTPKQIKASQNKDGSASQARKNLQKPNRLPQFTTNNVKANITTAVSSIKGDSGYAFIHRVQFTIPEGKGPDARLFLAKDKDSTFLQSLESTLKTDTNMQEAYNFMKEFFRQTIEADNSVRRYLASSSDTEQDKTKAINAGEAALNAMDKADTGLEQMLARVGAAAGKKIEKVGDERKLKESKFAQLDKLILEVLKNNH